MYSIFDTNTPYSSAIKLTQRKKFNRLLQYYCLERIDKQPQNSFKQISTHF